jgi:hypothetical protein
MGRKPRTPKETYGPALEKARIEFPQLNPELAALRAAVSFEAADNDQGPFAVPFLGAAYRVDWPGGAVTQAADGRPADIATQLVLLHYLLTADGTPMASKWIAFRNLPGGMGYEAAFRGRAPVRLARAFGHDRKAFEQASRQLGGEPLSFGDAAFLFRVLPRMWMAVVLHVADEEFPADANILFDAAAEHYLPTEDLAVVGGMLAGRLIKLAQAR